MANEVSRIEAWIYATLTNDAGVSGLNTLVAGRIYPYLADQGASYPLVIYSHQAGADVQGLGTDRVMTRPLYLVKIISQGIFTDAAKSAVDRIDELLGKAVSSVKNGYVFSGRREQSVSFSETVEGEQGGADHFRHVGGLYRIEAYPA